MFSTRPAGAGAASGTLVLEPALALLAAGSREGVAGGAELQPTRNIAIHDRANHAYGRKSVNSTYIAQAFDHLAECQAKIEAALWARITAGEKRRGKLKAV